MDILVPDSSSRRAGVPASLGQARPYEARIWGLVAAAVVLGFLLLIGVFAKSDRQQLAANEPAKVRTAPAQILPENPALP
jgi:hypothetical protein